jgi:hypothetical protein
LAVPFRVHRFALLACCLVAGCGDYCLYQGACIDPDHFSLDPSPIQVDLTLANRKTAGQNFAKLRVPRSYVVFGNNYGSLKGPLPEQFATNQIAIRFVDGGEAWNVAVDRESRSMGRTQAEKNLRSGEYRVSLHANANPNSQTDRQADIAGYGNVRQPDRYDGLIHFSGGSQEIYVGEASDSFESISCFRELNPSWFCTYQVDLGDMISASATFLDFRLHGGRAYANLRAQFVRVIVCRSTDCEADEARRQVDGAPVHRRPETKRVHPAGDCTENCRRGTRDQRALAFPPAATQQTFWRLRVPAYFAAEDAWPRTDASRSLSGFMLYPEMVPSDPIQQGLRRAWLTVPVGDEERPAFSIAPADTPCLTNAELSLEELAERTIHIRLRPPADYPQTAQNEPILECGTRPCASPHFCFMEFLRDGWHVDISFRSKWQRDVDRIRDQVNSYLDQITLSRDPVPVISPTPAAN